jgi:cytoskeleton protein RodZ
VEDTAATAPPPARSIGQRLRAGRERSGLSVAAAAEKLHLDNRVIEALEADRFAELGASVYVRGHLRRYADFVGEPGAELVEMYTSRVAPPPPPDLTQVPHPERRSDPRRLLTPLIGLSAAFILAAAIWWVLAGSQPGAESASGSVTSSAVVAAPAGSVVPAVEISKPTAIAATPQAPPPAPVVTPAARDAAPRPEPPARETRLKLELTNDSWVEIYDARGERLFYDVASAGSVQSVTGRGPLRVVLGNASGVSVEVDGETRDIPANAVDGEGARFVVNRSGSLSRAR